MQDIVDTKTARLEKQEVSHEAERFATSSLDETTLSTLPIEKTTSATSSDHASSSATSVQPPTTPTPVWSLETIRGGMAVLTPECSLVHRNDAVLSADGKWICVVCRDVHAQARSYNSRLSWAHHFDQVHAHPSVTRYACADCDKRFPTAEGLRRHRNIHSKEREFVCPECDKAFTHRGTLDNHRKSHTKKRAMSTLTPGADATLCKCPECGEAFARRFHMLRHMQARHPAQAPASTSHHCHVCNVTVARADNFQSHLKSTRCRMRHEAHARAQTVSPATLVQQQEVARRARGRAQWNVIQPPANPLAPPPMIATQRWNGSTMHSQPNAYVLGAE